MARRDNGSGGAQHHRICTELSPAIQYYDASTEIKHRKNKEKKQRNREAVERHFENMILKYPKIGEFF